MESIFDFTEWEDDELTKEWNRLDQGKGGRYVDIKVEAIEKECQKRRIVAWDKDGNITQRD